MTLESVSDEAGVAEPTVLVGTLLHPALRLPASRSRDATEPNAVDRIDGSHAHTLVRTDGTGLNALETDGDDAGTVRLEDGVAFLDYADSTSLADGQHRFDHVTDRTGHEARPIV